MNLLYLSSPGGGLDTNVRVLAPALVRAGHRVTVLYIHFPNESVLPDESANGYQVYHAAMGSWHYYADRLTFRLTGLANAIRALEYAQTLSKMIKQIHQREPLDLIELPEVFVAPRWTHNIPYVVRLHSSAWMWRRMCHEPAPVSDSIDARLEGYTLRRARGISSPSQFVADYIRQTCGIAKPIKIIPYPIDTARFAPGARRDDPPVILFVGRVEKRKGADVLLQAIPLVRQKFPDCQFVFAGSVSKELSNFPLLLGEELGVRFLGVRPRDELVQWYQRASIFVAPSLWDNSPNTIYEAMACGTPVVATRVGGIPELVDDGVTGLLVPPCDENALADAIVTLFGDAARREEMGRCAREKAVECYASEEIIAQTLSFYERATASHVNVA